MHFIIIVTSFFASSANGALSAMRVGNRKMIQGDMAFEFGRPHHAIDDVHAAFQEMKFIQMRFLGDGSIVNNAGSFSLPGMSLPYHPGSMSFPYFPGSMSLGPLKPTWNSPSIHGSDNSTWTPSPTRIFTSHVPSIVGASQTCIPQDLTASTQIHVQLDVDSLSNQVAFLDLLAQGILSFAEMHFLLCARSVDQRRLLQPIMVQEESNAIVTGIDASVTASDSVYDTCTPASEGAFCTVVNLVLSVYSRNEDSSPEAEQHVYEDVMVKQLEAGSFVDGDMIAIRFHAEKNSPFDSTGVNSDRNQGAPVNERNNRLTTFQTVVICVLVFLVASALVVGLVYRKRMSNQRASSDHGSREGDSNCADSTNDDIAAV